MKIEKTKNLILILLIISLMLLTYITWSIGLTNANIPENSWFYRFSDIFINNNDIVEKETYIPMPIEITLKNDTDIYVSEYSSDVKIVYESISNIIYKSLNVRSDIIKDTNDNFNKALDGDIIIVRYANNISLDMLMSSFGSTAGESDIVIETIAFSPKCVFIREAVTGDIYSFRNNELISFDISSNDYILSKDYVNAGLNPEIALPNTAIKYPLIEEANNTISPDEIVKAFSYNPYIVKKYKSDGHTIYVENFSTIKISDKNIEFDITDLRGGIKIITGADDSDTVKRIQKIARSKSILADISPDKNIELDKIYIDGNTGREVIIFKQIMGGIGILEESDFARFEFTDNVLVKASINLNSFVVSKDKVYILPKKQAAIISDKKSLILVYEKMEDNIYKPVWKGV